MGVSCHMGFAYVCCAGDKLHQCQAGGQPGRTQLERPSGAVVRQQAAGLHSKSQTLGSAKLCIQDHAQLKALTSGANSKKLVMAIGQSGAYSKLLLLLC